MTFQTARIVHAPEADRMSVVAWQAPAAQSAVAALLPIMGVVLVAFLVIGMALPVLPLHVHQDLGFGAFVVGLVTGSQFVAALASRVWSGHFSDRKGAKRAMMAGLLTAVTGGLLYFMSLQFTARPGIRVSILLLGRALLGGAESFIITGGVIWGLVLAGERNAGARHCTGRYGNVRCACGRCAARHRALSRRRLCRNRRRNDAAAACHNCARRRTGAGHAAARRTLGIAQGRRRGLDAEVWLGVQQHRLRLDDRVQLAAVSRTPLESCVAVVQRLRGRPGCRASAARAHP